ncbi:MAG: chloramphenicol acetyltransferase [Wenzhouxiangellaceae bacterium]
MLDLERWPRREQYELFRHYEQPFFNICAPLDVTALAAYCRQRELSFFIASLFLSTLAVNAVEAFRYRLREDGVVIHDQIDAGSTVLRQDDTFTFGYFEYHPNFSRFNALARQQLDSIQAGGSLDPRDDRDDLIHYSVIPWLVFTSFAHARRLVPLDSVPKIVFGRYSESAERLTMPVSVEVHHALMDGLHVAHYFEQFQQALYDCVAVLGGEPADE